MHVLIPAYQLCAAVHHEQTVFLRADKAWDINTLPKPTQPVLSRTILDAVPPKYAQSTSMSGLYSSLNRCSPLLACRVILYNKLL